MCGLAGIVYRRGDWDRGVALHALKAMGAAQSHRGPDGEGCWHQEVGGADVLLTHARLAIFDLSPAGLQPMVSSCGRYVLLYNGALYNFLELRAALEKQGAAFCTRSDTEVVLQALMHWGTAAFERFNGMWALAFCDLTNRTLVLSRDRFGEKPLYYYRNRKALFFSSEIKAICAATDERFPVNTATAALFLGQSLLQASPDQTFFSGIRRVPAGHFLTIGLDDDRAPVLGEPRAYWQYPAPTEDHRPEEEQVERVREILLDAVRLRLRGDVPVGVLVSGGLDSSSILGAIHQLHPERELHLLSMVSEDPDTNEEPYIDAMARHLGRPVQKVLLRMDAGEAFDWLDRAIWFNDEPVGDFSVAAHLMLMMRAREVGVTVLLSGQGGDELLCGYSKYYAFYLQQLLRERRYPKLMSVAWGLAKPPMTWIRSIELAEAKRYLPGKTHANGVAGPRLRGEALFELGLGDGPVQVRQTRDIAELSVPALTHYEDRMSMAAGREIRLPFLDHRMVEELLPLSCDWKLRDGWTKWILRKAMANNLPRAIAWRRDKNGFSNPLRHWLRDGQGAIEKILSQDLVTESLGLVDRDQLQQLYHRYRSGGDPRIGVKDLFNPLALELWARHYQSHLQPADLAPAN